MITEAYRDYLKGLSSEELHDMMRRNTKSYLRVRTNRKDEDTSDPKKLLSRGVILRLLDEHFYLIQSILDDRFGKPQAS